MSIKVSTITMTILMIITVTITLMIIIMVLRWAAQLPGKPVAVQRGRLLS